MIVGIVGVALEVRMHAFDPSILIAANVDPITSDLAIGRKSHLNTYALVVDAELAL
jgi:hypothetical protein|tara:strand:- start:36642 stop:36809 length:168 start_codon:yes stop_codon:yes gene_type:complete